MTAPTCPFVAGQTYRTRDGREALIYCTDAPGQSPIHGRIAGSILGAASWGADGVYGGAGVKGSLDLLPPAPPRIREKRWVNVQHDGTVTAFRVEVDAIYRARGSALYARVAVPCELVEIVEGEGA